MVAPEVPAARLVGTGAIAAGDFATRAGASASQLVQSPGTDTDVQAKSRMMYAFGCKRARKSSCPGSTHLLPSLWSSYATASRFKEAPSRRSA
eukprot:scaffold196_cov371-Prasinococcus_capsulatus_cf.AAC.17